MGIFQGRFDFASILIKFLVSALVVFLVLPLHEYAHGLAAYKLGDKTAKYRGRLKLNPLVHIDPIGAIALFLFDFGWAKPVPVDPRYFKNPKRDMAIVALAGPASNFLAAIIGGLFLHLNIYFFKAAGGSAFYWVSLFLQYYIVINISLTVFNLIPIPPLDGSKVLTALLPNRLLQQYYYYERYISIFGMLILFRVISRQNGVLSLLRAAITSFVLWLTGLPFSASWA